MEGLKTSGSRKAAKPQNVIAVSGRSLRPWRLCERFFLTAAVLDSIRASEQLHPLEIAPVGGGEPARQGKQGQSVVAGAASPEASASSPRSSQRSRISVPPVTRAAAPRRSRCWPPAGRLGLVALLLPDVRIGGCRWRGSPWRPGPRRPPSRRRSRPVASPATPSPSPIQAGPEISAGRCARRPAPASPVRSPRAELPPPRRTPCRNRLPPLLEGGHLQVGVGSRAHLHRRQKRRAALEGDLDLVGPGRHVEGPGSGALPMTPPVQLDDGPGRAPSTTMRPGASSRTSVAACSLGPSLLSSSSCV